MIRTDKSGLPPIARLPKMGRKTGKKKRGAAKNTVPKAAPLVAATVFGGSFSLEVPQGWMHPAEVLASGLDARPSEQFVSRRALSGPGFATLMVDVVPAHIRDLGGPSGAQRLMEFVRYQEEENVPTFKAPMEAPFEQLPPFERAWLVEYKSVGKLQGRTTRTTAILMTSPEADVILRLNNGDTENVSFHLIAASLRRVPGAPPPQPYYPEGSKLLSRLPVPETIELDFDELEAVAKDRDVDVDFLWMTAQAMCFSDAEMASMDAAARQKVDTLLRCDNFMRYRHAALGVPTVKRRIEDVQKRRIEEEEYVALVEKRKQRMRAAAKKGPRQAASEPVEDPRERARRIEVAAAVCEAAIRALPPHEDYIENARCRRVVQILHDAIITDKNDAENFYEYMELQRNDPQQLVKFMTRWTHLRKYWPRLRRRICVNCGACIDLSKPRFLVCGGCAEGSGVGRYCSEICQAEHWPAHQDLCPRIDHASVEARPWLRKMQNFILIDGTEQAKSAGHSPGEYLDVVAKGLAEKYGTIDEMPRCQVRKIINKY